jgi:hypothetical protein
MQSHHSLKISSLYTLREQVVEIVDPSPPNRTKTAHFDCGQVNITIAP